MRVRDHQDGQLEEFIAARTQDLHHDAYQFTAAQQPAEELVIAVLAAMRREQIDMAQAGSTARLRMAKASVRDNTPTQDSDASQLAAQFRPLARLSPRQRAVLALQVVDNYDERETSRVLRMTTRAVTDTIRSIPYDELPGASPHSGELRSLLEDFGDLATAPSASTTLADVRAVPPPPRRPWWTYVAALLVIALTVGTIVISQSRYEEWAHSPKGLNHIHGTHFPAYTEGYKLVAIHDVKPGPPAEFSVDGSGAVTMNCADLRPGLGISSSSELNSGTYFNAACSAKAQQPQLIPAGGQTSVSINDSSRPSWPVAVYRKVSWEDYPVATGHFVVARDKTVDALRRQTGRNGQRITPLAAGTVLTMRGPAGSPNGTFRGQLELPASAGATELDITGLLSPTTTGRFRVRLNGQAPWMNCASSNVTRMTLHPDDWCGLYDRHIPQVDFSTVDASSTLRTRRITVELSVQHARGPWTLQVVADRYKTDASAVDDGANG
jgi:DNA-directed RNA polymerase specialized sigma subunit, sigma24 homolog